MSGDQFTADTDREVRSELLLARLAVLQYGTNINQIAVAPE